MSDLIDTPDRASNTPEYTVGEISGAVKKTLESSFNRIRVRGEVGRVVRAASGHLYFDIKDDRNVLACNTWKGQVAGLGVMPEEGLEVIVTGKITSYGGQSKYNMNVDSIEVAGEGALMVLLEKRKKALAAEGLFAPERKRDLPYLPEIIGVVTSPTGAVIRDILHRLRDRFPRKVLIWPVAVQGERCAPEVAAAIEGFNRLTPGGALPRPDLLIVARGGGSIEDLWGFNEEIVARAAAASEIPLISAVGHETDTTLIDYASDRRAPTPTAAAELAVPVRVELLAWVEGQGARLTRATGTGVSNRGQRLRDLARALPRPEALVASAAQRLDIWGERLPGGLRSVTSRKRITLSDRAGALRPSLLRQGLSGQARQLREVSGRLPLSLGRALTLERRAFETRAERLRPAMVTREVARKSESLSALTARFHEAARSGTQNWRNRIEALERLRQTLGYTETLKRGFTVVRQNGEVITSRKGLSGTEPVEIQFSDGRVDIEQGEKPAPTKPKPKKAKDTPPDQGSLF